MAEDSGKKRFILIVACFVNIFLYYSAYAYFDNILVAIARFELPVGLLTFIKYFIIFVLGFLIGFLIILAMRLEVRINYFDLKVLLLVGFVPALAIIFSYTNFLNVLLGTPGETAGDLYYYFFSRTDIWSIWLGVATGASVRTCFGRKRYKHHAIR